MDLKTTLLKEHSKGNSIYIASYIGSDKVKFEALMELFFNGEYKVTQRAAWVVGMCFEAYPTLIDPYIQQLLENLKNTSVHDAVKRNTFSILQYRELPDAYLELAANIGFDYFNNKNEAIAIRVFAMTFMTTICKKLPELKEELRILIEDELPYGSAGFVSRGKKMLALLI